MESKLCKNFTVSNPIIVENTIPVRGTLNFSADFWQPFIDILVIDNVTQICGPLLALVVEVSKKLKFSLSYISDEHIKDECFSHNFQLLENNETNIMIYPLVPSNVMNITNLFELSRCMGDVTMISILSSKGDLINSSFKMLKAFTIPVWVSVITAYIFTAGITSYISRTDKSFMDYLAIFFRQQLSRFDRNEPTSMISLIWLFASSILTWALSGALLMFLVFSSPHQIIDSMADLANKQIEFSVLKGENALDYVTDVNGEYTQLFANKYRIEDPPTKNKTIWENEILTKISSNNYALVSDKAFLDYYFAKKLIEFPNLYRSKENLLTLPYFIPISKHSSQTIIKHIKYTIDALTESGIYDSWTRDTLTLNNVAVRKGYIELHQMKYEFLPIIIRQLEGVFYIQLIGFSLSFIILIIEFLINLSKKIQSSILCLIRENVFSRVSFN